MMKKLFMYAFILFLAGRNSGFAYEDPWFKLQEKFGRVEINSVLQLPDPWKKLRTVFLPFSSEEEEQAALNPTAAKNLAQKIDARLVQYASIIEKASKTFKIPNALIQSVIMAESGGDCDAAAKTTSAKGLMQTIDSTFKMAKAGLANQGIHILNNPFDPEASIMAGSWYLDRMYKKVVSDKKMNNSARTDISSWRYPLEYYYAGPGNGVKAENKIFVFSNGTKRIIDKRAYSKKIQSWAKILERV